jgi:hypothetical protein
MTCPIFVTLRKEGASRKRHEDHDGGHPVANFQHFAFHDYLSPMYCLPRLARKVAIRELLYLTYLASIGVQRS